MKLLIEKLLRARENQLALFDDKPDWHRSIGRKMVYRAFVFMFLPFAGAIYLLGCAVYYRSLEAFGGFVLATAACILLSVPHVYWYLKIYGDKDT